MYKYVLMSAQVRINGIIVHPTAVAIGSYFGNGAQKVTNCSVTETLSANV